MYYSEVQKAVGDTCLRLVKERIGIPTVGRSWAEVVQPKVDAIVGQILQDLDLKFESDIPQNAVMSQAVQEMVQGLCLLGK